MENTVIELQFSLNTFYFLVSGILVMWMAAGFAMLEAGLVRSKNTTEILTKNIALYAIACTMFLLVGYNIMYVDNVEGGVVPNFGALIGSAAADADHALESDFFFQVVFVATAMSIVSGAVAERMKLWAFLLFTVVLTGLIYPIEGYWTWGAGFLSEMGFVDFAAPPLCMVPVPRLLWLACCCWVLEKVNMARMERFIQFQVQTYHWRHWVLSFYGWVGLALMVALNYFWLIKVTPSQ